MKCRAFEILSSEMQSLILKKKKIEKFHNAILKKSCDEISKMLKKV